MRKRFIRWSLPSIALLTPMVCSSQVSPSASERLEGQCNRFLQLAGSPARDVFHDSPDLRQATCRCATARLPQVALDLETGHAIAQAKAASTVLSCLAEAIEKRNDAAPLAIVADLAPAIMGSVPSTTPARLVMGETCKPPQYPAVAVRAEAVGTSVIEYKVDANGRVSDSRVVRSAGTTAPHKILDAAAQFAFMSCTFTPGSTSDGPTPTATRIMYQWKLAD